MPKKCSGIFAGHFTCEMRERVKKADKVNDSMIDSVHPLGSPNISTSPESYLALPGLRAVLPAKCYDSRYRRHLIQGVPLPSKASQPLNTMFR